MHNFVVVLSMVFMCGIANADVSIIDTVKKLPSMKQGACFSVIDNKFNYLTTMEVMSFKGFSLEAGYAGSAKQTADKIAGVISYDLFNAKKYGITIPVLDLVSFRPGIYVGYGRIEGAQDGKVVGEFDAGISATIIDVKF